jgi:hypothetical protein
MFRRPVYIYDDPPEDNLPEPPLQWSGRNGININNISIQDDGRDRHRIRILDDRNHYRPSTPLSQGYRHITVPREHRDPPPRWDPCGIVRPPRYRSYSRFYPSGRPSPLGNRTVTVLLQQSETTVIDSRYLDRHFPNASQFIVNGLLDIPAFLNDQHRSRTDDSDFDIYLPQIARHVFVHFSEEVEMQYPSLFDQMHRFLDGGREDIMRAGHMAFAMSCLFDQQRSLGCSEELGGAVMRFLAEAILLISTFDTSTCRLLAMLLFDGAVRVMVDERGSEQERMLRSIWEMINERRGWFAETLEMEYRRIASSGGVEAGRARRVLDIIL